MKVGIVGSGLVGATVGYALVMRGVGREVVLVNRNHRRAESEAADISHAVPFAEPLQVSAGHYEDLRGCRVVIITAGVNQRPGETRLELLGRNAAILQQIVPEVLDHAPGTILLITTNPVDIMTHLAARYASAYGVHSSRVVGSGTTLDTARYRTLVGRYVGVDPHHIHGYVIGEHGDSEVLTWSSVTVAAMPLVDFCAYKNLSLDDEVKQSIEEQVHNAAYEIIEGKGATYYGIGSAVARIVQVILGDQRSVLTVCTPVQAVEGVRHVTLSLPNLVGGRGAISQIPPRLSDHERARLRKSAEIIRSAIDKLGTA